jgi:inosine triphosphate pyrophosphatase
MNTREIFFIIGNEGKYSEIAALVPGLQRVSMDLPEVQSLDPNEVVGEKLREAAGQSPERSFIVEDTSLSLACLNGFPGPLIKWFMQSLGCAGIAELCLHYGNTAAWSETVIGLKLAGENEPFFFNCRLKGTIVVPQGDGGFGWDPIFVPEGETLSLAETKQINPGPPRMRREAGEKLAAFLSSFQ